MIKKADEILKRLEVLANDIRKHQEGMSSDERAMWSRYEGKVDAAIGLLVKSAVFSCRIALRIAFKAL